MKVVVVTGYVPIPGHPRDSVAYERLGSRLLEITNAPVRLFRSGLESCWLAKHVGKTVRVAGGDNPQKNSLAYHVVQHQKTMWLLEAFRTDPSPDVFVWIDYGICHLPDVTPAIIDDFLDRVRSGAKPVEITIPGCWEASSGSIEWPDWRFCGCPLIVHRELVSKFHRAVEAVTLNRLEADGSVTWEVNDWAAVERQGLLPIRWYKADHNRTMFDNYS